MLCRGDLFFVFRFARQIVELSRDPATLKDHIFQQLERNQMSALFMDFLLEMFEVDVEKRCTAVEALAHPWMQPNEARGKARASVVAITRNFDAFTGMTKLQQTAYMAVSVGLTNADVTEMNAMFQDMDTNKDGVLSFDEFRAVMIGVTGQTDRELRIVFDAIDQDSTGVIKYSEFVAAAYQHQDADLEDVIEAAFYRLDVSDSGTITLDDLRQILPASMLDDEVRDLLTLVDTNQDNSLDLAEFRALMKMTEEVEKVKSTRSADSVTTAAGAAGSGAGSPVPGEFGFGDDVLRTTSAPEWTRMAEVASPKVYISTV